MLVLGVQRGHDAGVCLMRDGDVLCAVEAERVFGIKHADGAGVIPETGRRAFAETGVSPHEVDRVVLADSFREHIEQRHGHLADRYHGPELLAGLGTIGALAVVGGDLGVVGLRPDAEVYGVCHHAAHAAGAIYMSGFDECVAYAYDGYGACCATLGYLYSGGRLTRLEETRDRILVGWRYQLLAYFLRDIDKSRTKVYDLAGKVMGLNAFGAPERRVVDELKAWLKRDYQDYQRSWNSNETWFPGLVNESGFTRDSHSARDPDFLRLLASFQQAMDEAVCEDIADILARHAARRVVVTGGCAYNILTNAALQSSLPQAELFVPPNAGDCGLAMGAAVIGSANAASALHWPQIALSDKRSPYKGLTLAGPRAGAAVNYDALDAVAARLAAGGIVGLAKGRCEIGPRALGARSLLADATRADMREVINARVKKREWWRPFAPVARSVDAHRYFDFDVEDHYMLRSATVREEWRARLAPVTHADNSARLQIVPDEAANPELWHILTRLEQLTGVGVCLNTSLNLGGRPIVNSREEILELLRSQDIDFVYLDGEIVGRDAARP